MCGVSIHMTKNTRREGESMAEIGHHQTVAVHHNNTVMKDLNTTKSPIHCTLVSAKLRGKLDKFYVKTDGVAVQIKVNIKNLFFHNAEN